MTNEQIIIKIQELTEKQIKSEIERKQIFEAINELKEGVEVTRKLAEDIHIMAINIENMQKTLDSTVKKVEDVERKDYNNYLESKKTIKNNVLSGLTGSILKGLFALILFIIGLYLGKGGI